MKSHWRWIVGLIVVAMVCGMQVQQSTAKDEQPSKLLRHVVLFTFTEEATPAQIDELVKAFGELPSQIPEIYKYEWGTNNSPEGLTKGHTHCFLVTFKTEADRDAYLPHAAHQAFVVKLKPLLEDVTVIDYWANE